MSNNNINSSGMKSGMDPSLMGNSYPEMGIGPQVCHHQV